MSPSGDCPFLSRRRRRRRSHCFSGSFAAKRQPWHVPRITAVAPWGDQLPNNNRRHNGNASSVDVLPLKSMIYCAMMILASRHTLAIKLPSMTVRLVRREMNLPLLFRRKQQQRHCCPNREPTDSTTPSFFYRPWWSLTWRRNAVVPSYYNDHDHATSSFTCPDDDDNDGNVAMHSGGWVLRGGARSETSGRVLHEADDDKAVPKQGLGYQLSLSSGNNGVSEEPNSDEATTRKDAAQQDNTSEESSIEKGMVDKRETKKVIHHQQQKLLTLSPNAIHGCEGGRRLLRVTVVQDQGARKYMEDTHLVGFDCVAIFDGHGGKAVSRYLKQNLLAELQRAAVATQEKLSITFSNEAPSRSDASVPSITNNDDKTSLRPTNSPHPMTVHDYVNALEKTLDKVDQDVQKISHWSYQGSTAVVAWLHEDGDGEEKHYQSSNNMDQRQKEEAVPSSAIQNSSLTLVVANIGDSRAILSRGGQPIALTRDHKPDDPEEYSRIISLGGKVTVRGTVARVNGNLALSRALGDRSERPYVTAEPEFTTIPLQRNEDEFILLATDGLWDVMTNWEVVDFVLSHLQEETEMDQLRDSTGSESGVDLKDKITRMLVEEALARGSYDNISVVIIWLRE